MSFAWLSALDGRDDPQVVRLARLTDAPPAPPEPSTDDVAAAKRVVEHHMAAAQQYAPLDAED